VEEAEVEVEELVEDRSSNGPMSFCGKRNCNMNCVRTLFISGTVADDRPGDVGGGSWKQMVANTIAGK